MQFFKKLPAAPRKTVCWGGDFGKNGPEACVATNLVVNNGKLCSAESYQACSGLANVYGGCETPIGLFFAASDGVYLQTQRETRRLAPTVFDAATFLWLEDRQVMVISQPNIGTFECTNDHISRMSTVGFQSLALCKQRVFGVSGSVLYFTSRDDLDQYFTVQLPSPMRGLAAVGDEVFLVGNDLYRLRFDELESKSRVDCICQNVGEVAADSIAVVGTNLLFVTRRGVNCLNGTRLTVLPLACLNFTRPLHATACEGQYFLCCNEGVRRVLQIDVPSLSVVARHRLAASFLCGRVAVADSKMHLFGGGFGDGFWQSKPVDFGFPFVKKRLKSLVVDTRFPVSIHVITENERQIYNILGAPGLQKVGLCGTFRTMKVEIHSSGAAEVARLFVHADLPQSEVNHA